VGEGFWKRVPNREYLEVLGATPSELQTELGNIRVAEGLGLRLAEHWSATEEEWDAFEDAYLDGIESYAREQPEDPNVPDMLRRIHRWRRGYVRWGKKTLGLGVYLFRTGPLPARGGSVRVRARGGTRRTADSAYTGQYGERPQRDHLARATHPLEGERRGSVPRVLGVPAGGPRAPVGVDRVEVPAPIGPLFLPQV
jgi:hypothetical protein